MMFRSQGEPTAPLQPAMQRASSHQALPVVQLQENARPISKGGDYATAWLPGASTFSATGLGQAGSLARIGTAAPGEQLCALQQMPLQAAPQLCKLPAGALAPAKLLNAAGGQRLYIRNTPESTPTAREVLGPVDGSPTAGGLTSSSQPSKGYTSSGAIQQRGFSMGSFPCTPPSVSQHLGLDRHRRKRPADPVIFIDDEFRDGHRGPGTSNAANSVASVPSLGSTHPCLSTASSPRAAAAAALALLTGSGSTFTQAEEEESIQAMATDDVEMEEGSPDKENKPPEPLSTPSEAADLPSAEWILPASGSDAEPSGSAHPWAARGEPLAERVLEVPVEYQEHQYSDIESSDEEFQSENLADRLAERVQQNADGRYDFDIYEDP